LLIYAARKSLAAPESQRLHGKFLTLGMKVWLKKTYWNMIRRKGEYGEMGKVGR